MTAGRLCLLFLFFFFFFLKNSVYKRSGYCLVVILGFISWNGCRHWPTVNDRVSPITRIAPFPNALRRFYTSRRDQGDS